MIEIVKRIEPDGIVELEKYFESNTMSFIEKKVIIATPYKEVQEHMPIYILFHGYTRYYWRKLYGIANVCKEFHEGSFHVKCAVARALNAGMRVYVLNNRVQLAQLILGEKDFGKF